MRRLARRRAWPYDTPVDFEQVLKTLLGEFERRQIRYAAVGGFALGVFGFKRATMDLDFLIHRDDLGHVHEAMLALGYRRYATTENVSHYVHPDASGGAVDFIHAFRTSSLEMFARTRAFPLFEGTLQLRVVAPEDLIGFKVQALANNPKRSTKEWADIEGLIDACGEDRLDWQRIQEYFELFDLGEEGRKLHERSRHAE